MSQKSSVPQATKFVSQTLKQDSRDSSGDMRPYFGSFCTPMLTPARNYRAFIKVTPCILSCR
jgi:hypothetical protein